jgi:hypothetical protein
MLFRNDTNILSALLHCNPITKYVIQDGQNGGPLETLLRLTSEEGVYTLYRYRKVVFI